MWRKEPYTLRTALSVAVAIGALWGLACVASPDSPDRELKTKSVSVTARQIEFDLEANQFTATGKPELTSPDMKLTSDRIVVQLDKEGKDVSEMRAAGNVVIVMRYRDKGTGQIREVTATGNEANLLQPQEKLVLSGKARMTMQGGGGKVGSASIVGSKITYSLKDRRILVESGEDELPTRLDVVGLEDTASPEKSR